MAERRFIIKKQNYDQKNDAIYNINKKIEDLIDLIDIWKFDCWCFLLSYFKPSINDKGIVLWWDYLCFVWLRHKNGCFLS